ncbi:MAG: type II secretion system major pseudopilin GspG [Phycisphaerales bacterium]|jgi:general secretion pathway protein G|nr:type II secretion system major pseudopilin GspG [Phycisphaerales bacterium]
MSNNRNKHRSNYRAFTLIEIIVVVMIIAVLATLIAPRLFQRVGSAKQTAAKAQAATIAKTVTLYVLDMGLTIPSNDFDLDVLRLNADDGGGPQGPYLERDRDLIDPWGNPFEIIIPGEVNSSFDIISYGEDGEPGGDGSSEDITH